MWRRDVYAPFASPSFIIPKADKSVLPRWVNNYRKLNTIIIPDRYPLPRIEDISFFQMLMNPDHIKYTATLTPTTCHPRAIKADWQNIPCIPRRYHHLVVNVSRTQRKCYKSAGRVTERATVLFIKKVNIVRNGNGFPRTSYLRERNQSGWIKGRKGAELASTEICKTSTPVPGKRS